MASRIEQIIEEIEEYIGANPKEGYRELFMLEDVVAFLVENATVKQPE